MSLWKFIEIACLLLLVACGSPGVTTSTPVSPAFAISVTGHVEFSAISYTVERIPESGVFSLNFINSATAQTVQVFFEPQVAAGSAVLIGSSEAMNPNRSPHNGVWLLVQGANTRSGADPLYFSKNPAGVVHVTALGDLIRGDFSITLEDADGQQITAAGTFAGIPLEG